MFSEWWKERTVLLSKLEANVPVVGRLRRFFSFVFTSHRHVFPDLIGLDIGSDFIKLMKINCSESENVVENFSIYPLPIGAVVKGEIKQTAIVANAIREMIKQANTNVVDVALAIPRSLAIFKNITIDSRLNLDEIESRVWIEANRHFPELTNDIYLDFFVSGPSAHDASQLEVVLVACRKEHIKPYVDMMKSIGLRASIVDIDSFALERALLLIAKPLLQTIGTIALLQLDGPLSTLIVIREGKLIYAHEQAFDGQRLMAQVKAFLETKEAAFISDANHLLQDEGYQRILKENLVSHLQHILHFFYSSRPNIAIQKLMLAGDCTQVPALFSFVQQEVSIETENVNLLSELVLSPAIDVITFKKYESALMLCCGLALTKLELE
ncbi:MAG: type IV pilus assembly protein PilM [Gammaproteobacteria bacterium]